MRRTSVFALALVSSTLLLAGHCGPDPVTPTQPDGGVVPEEDAGEVDSAVVEDAGEVDASVEDAGQDAGQADAGPAECIPFCNKLTEVKCAEAAKCLVTCEHILATRFSKLNASCVLKATTKAAIAKCGSVKCS
jgi:hypothetical protein